MSGKYPRPPVKRDARKRNYMAKPVSLHTKATEEQLKHVGYKNLIR